VAQPKELAAMDIIQRAKNICLTPAAEWTVIAAEPATAGALITGYAAPLAAIGAVAGFIGGAIVGTTLPFVGYYRVPLASALISAIFTFGMALVGVFVLSLIIDALAPTFGGQKNSLQALKVAVYSYTPAWIAGVLHIVPLLGILGIFAALYSLYVLYLGLPLLMQSPKDKAIPYTVVVVLCAIVLSVVIAAVGGLVVGAGMVGSGALTSGALTGGVRGGSSDVQFDKNSPMGKLQDLGKKLEESNKKMEAAGKSGDPNAQAAAAVEGLGMLLGGGKRVDPVSIDQLKPLVPDTFGGLPKTSGSAEKSGIAGLMVSKAEARYSDGAGKTVTLEISDTGGVSGIMALAGWAGVQGEREDDNSSERTQKVNGRLVHEKVSKRGGTNEFAVVLADRFVVSASGNGVDVGTLKAAVSGLDLGKLESMKDAGVSR
jgi:hypothetical protein